MVGVAGVEQNRSFGLSLRRPRNRAKNVYLTAEPPTAGVVPARDKGIDTLIINQDRLAFAKDLDKDAPRAAQKMIEFSPDNTLTALK
jgi:hypothetical protein